MTHAMNKTIFLVLLMFAIIVPAIIAKIVINSVITLSIGLFLSLLVAVMEIIIYIVCKKFEGRDYLLLVALTASIGSGVTYAIFLIR